MKERNEMNRNEMNRNERNVSLNQTFLYLFIEYTNFNKLSNFILFALYLYDKFPDIMNNYNGVNISN